MKKIGIIGVIIISLFFPNLVKADTLIIPTEHNKTDYENNINITNINRLMEEYNNNWKDEYTYYVITIGARSGYNETILGVKNRNQIEYKYVDGWAGIYICGQHLQINIENNEIVTNESQESDETCSVLNVITEDTEEVDYDYYDSNINIAINYGNWEYNEVVLEDFYTDNIILNNGSIYPKLKDLLQYQNYSDYLNNHLVGYNEINLDNYLYVILTLKDYSRKNAFNTDLQVKGQVGITPIYNYGQTSKDSITGVKVQDRCNIFYDNYTTMPLYILESDLQNNVVYVVKKCANNSSFKYDTNIFNVFYVTEENKNDPIITIDGKQYHTIPFDDLPSTANQNEEENYIPGESGSANSEGGLSGALKNIQQKMSEIWDIITFFTGFVNQMFSILPEPIRIILLSAFAIAITLGLIKIFIN